MSGPSFGVEEEFLLVDPLTGRPVPRGREVAREAARRGVDVQLEFTTSQVETATGKAYASLPLREEISQLRSAVAESARAVGALLLAVGLPPTLGDSTGDGTGDSTGDGILSITDNPRYRRMVSQLGMITAERGYCGCHVHVEVPSRDAAIAVSNWLRPWLPIMLALTANSAIYRDADTGHASWRYLLWNRWPSAGPPPYFATVADYDRAVTMLLDGGAIFDDAMIYWHVRPSVRFPTVEVRIADVPATAAETVLHATLVRAAVMTALVAYERGEQAPAAPDHLVAAACWKAARDGISGTLIDVLGGGQTVPAAEVLKRWLAELGPALLSLGDADWVCAELRRLQRRGNGAIRQRRAWRQRDNALDVVDAAAVETLS